MLMQASGVDKVKEQIYYRALVGVAGLIESICAQVVFFLTFVFFFAHSFSLFLLKWRTIGQDVRAPSQIFNAQLLADLSWP